MRINQPILSTKYSINAFQDAAGRQKHDSNTDHAIGRKLLSTPCQNESTLRTIKTDLQHTIRPICGNHTIKIRRENLPCQLSARNGEKKNVSARSINQ